MKRSSARLLFVFGILSILFLVIAVGFVRQLFLDTFPEFDQNNTDSSLIPASELPVDPLVTVVPEEVRGGQPQPLDTDPQRGAEKPKVTIVEFGDFQCEACAAMDSVLDQLVTEYSDSVLHVWKDFPVPRVHEQAQAAAEAARCAQDQGVFWEYHDALLSQQDTLILQPWTSIAKDLSLDTKAFEVCLSSGEKEQLVVQGYFTARMLGIEETPTYYINDQLLTGAKTIEELRAIIEEELSE